MAGLFDDVKSLSSVAARSINFLNTYHALQNTSLGVPLIKNFDPMHRVRQRHGGVLAIAVGGIAASVVEGCNHCPSWNRARFRIDDLLAPRPHGCMRDAACLPDELNALGVPRRIGKL